MGLWVGIAKDDPKVFSGYLAMPPRGFGPGLLLLQEIWGVNGHIRDLAEQYAADGYVVLAPDMFWRQKARVELPYDEAGTARAYEHLRTLDFAEAQADLDAATAFLAGLPSVDGGIGALGYCLGGRLAFLAASGGKVQAAVSYYGSGLGQHIDQLRALACPMLFHFAEQDHLIPLAEARQWLSSIPQPTPVEHFVYAGRGHGFNCPYRPAYGQRDGALAKGRTLQFLARHL